MLYLASTTILWAFLVIMLCTGEYFRLENGRQFWLHTTNVRTGAGRSNITRGLGHSMTIYDLVRVSMLLTYPSLTSRNTPHGYT